MAEEPSLLLPTAGRADFVTPYQSTTDEVPLAGLNITSNAVVAVPGGFSANISQFDTQNGALTLTGLDTTVTFFRESLARFRADRPPNQLHVCRPNPDPFLGDAYSPLRSTTAAVIPPTRLAG